MGNKNKKPLFKRANKILIASNCNGVEEISESQEESITHPFDPSKIDISLRTMTLDLLIKRIEENEINLDTEFQRKSGLWDEEKQSRLTESLMIRIPLPAFYFDGTNDENWLVVDGLQRLNVFKKFIVEKSLKLNNLEFLTQYNGYSYSDLPRQMQRRIEETQVITFIINPGTPPEVKFNIFKRINTGGLTLEPQEIRHALNQGVPAKFLAELAETLEFKKATGNTIKTERMQDRDFVLRFLAFNMIHYSKYRYYPDLDTFLNKAMGNLNEMSEQELVMLKEKFIHAMKASIQIFGKYAFRKIYNKNEGRKPINKALFETLSVNLGNLSDSNLSILQKNKDVLMDKFILLMNDISFMRSITTGTGSNKAVRERFKKIESVIKEVVL